MKLIRKNLITKILSAAAFFVLFLLLAASTSFTSNIEFNNLYTSELGAVRPENEDIQPAKSAMVIGRLPNIDSMQLMGKVSENLDAYISKTEMQSTVKGNITETADVPKTSEPADRGANLNGYEQQILAIINNIRVSNGLNPLAASQALTDVARARSADMLSRDYFSHYTPEGLNIFNFLQSKAIGYRNAGENLAHSMPASAGSPQVFADAWMRSPTHRDNILRSAYNRIGIGIVENNGRRVVTTVFTN